MPRSREWRPAASHRLVDERADGCRDRREVARAVERVARALSEMGHQVSEESPAFDGPAAMRSMTDVWFFGFDLRLEGYAKRSGRAIGPDTLEPVVLEIYEYARRMKPQHFLAAMAALNHARRRLGLYFAKYDVWLSPTTPNVAEPWGTYNLARTDVTMENLTEKGFAGTCSFTLPHNITGTPAISLPLAMHSTGLPIGIQLGSRPATEHVLLQIAARFEEEMPWNGRVPPLHAPAPPPPPPARGRGAGRRPGPRRPVGRGAPPAPGPASAPPADWIAYSSA